MSRLTPRRYDARAYSSTASLSATSSIGDYGQSSKSPYDGGLTYYGEGRRAKVTSSVVAKKSLPISVKEPPTRSLGAFVTVSDTRLF